MIESPIAPSAAASYAELMRRLEAEGGQCLAGMSRDALWLAWSSAIDELRDPTSPTRRDLDESLAQHCGLSLSGLRAGLDLVLGGMTGAAAKELLLQAPTAKDRRPVVVFVAANLPGLAVQTVLPALSVGRPVLIKSPSSEPLFGPALVRCLTRQEPALAQAVAARTWQGGDREIETPVLAAAGRVVAYGDRTTIADLRQRVGGRLVAFGPMISLALVDLEDPKLDIEEVAHGLARDIALFDQRGCLSIQAVLVMGDPRPLAPLLARALADRAREWPSGPLSTTLAAAVQQLRAEADMRGLERPEQPLAEGTVVIEDRLRLQPSPGLRTVRLYRCQDSTQLAAELASWRGRLQGAALAGGRAWAWAPRLAEVEVSRCVAVGELQSTDAGWYNGGRSPVEALV